MICARVRFSYRCCNESEKSPPVFMFKRNRHEGECNDDCESLNQSLDPFEPCYACKDLGIQIVQTGGQAQFAMALRSGSDKDLAAGAEREELEWKALQMALTGDLKARGGTNSATGFAMATTNPTP